MSELKVIDVDKMADVRSLSGQFYLKSEADKVIADLRAQIVQADAECANALKESKDVLAKLEEQESVITRLKADNKRLWDFRDERKFKGA